MRCSIRCRWEPRSVGGELGERAQLVATRRLDHLEGVAPVRILAVELAHQLADLRRADTRNDLRELLRGDRLGRGEDQGLRDPSLLQALHGFPLT
jgi:hypothetical protein